MNLSEIAREIKPSLTRQLFDRAKLYKNVIDLTLGDPDYPTPNNVCEAGCRAILSGKTKYTANAGLPQLRSLIADITSKDTGVNYNANNVIVTVGAMGALYLLIKSYINEGDEVIIPAPYWINYGQIVRMSGGKPIYVNSEKPDFSLSVDNIEKEITGKTRLIIVNSPCNPTGEIYSSDTLEAIAIIAKKYDLLVVSDEAYSSIIFDGRDFLSIASIPGMNERTIIINSCSKRYSMTGWRCGYAIGNDEIISAMARLQENVASCCPQPSQYAAIEALSGEQKSVWDMVNGYEKRRDLFVEGINSIKGIYCRKPQGTFYVFVNIEGTGMTSTEFAFELLDKAQVAVVPGVTYGEVGEGYVRIALTQNEEILAESINRIRKFVSMIRG